MRFNITKISDIYLRWLCWVNNESDESIVAIENDFKKCFNFSYMEYDFIINNGDAVLYHSFNGNFWDMLTYIDFEYKVYKDGKLCTTCCVKGLRANEDTMMDVLEKVLN